MKRGCRDYAIGKLDYFGNLTEKPIKTLIEKGHGQDRDNLGVGRSYTEGEKMEIVRLYEEGKKPSAIGKEIGRTHNSVRHELRKIRESEEYERFISRLGE